MLNYIDVIYTIIENMSDNSLIVSAKRTPIGSFLGGLSSFSAPATWSKSF